MKCYCPKCGRNNDVSADEIRRQGGTVVCPKCLTTFQMPISNDDDDDTPPPIPARRQKTASARKATASDQPPKVPAARRSTSPARFCNKCGATIPAGRATCPECGQRAASTSGRRVISFSESTTPPPVRTPRRPATKPATKPTARTAAKKKTSKPKEESKPMSKVGCLLITCAITAGFFVLYALFGLLFDKL